MVELEFRLPVGFVDSDGAAHRTGAIRMACALDEIEAMGHPRVQANEAYLPLVVLSRVVTRLGTLATIDEHVIGALPVRDFQFLEQLYLRLNGTEEGDDLGEAVACPRCGSAAVDDLAPAG